MEKLTVELTPQQLAIARERAGVVGSTPHAIVEAAADCAFYFDLPLTLREALDKDRKSQHGPDGKPLTRRDYVRSVISRRYVDLVTSGRKLPKPLPSPVVSEGDTRTTVSVPLRLKGYVDERSKLLGSTKHVLTASLDDVATYFGSPPDQLRVLEGERALLSADLDTEEPLPHREHIRIILSEWFISLTTGGGKGRS
jgi:hypothetical protein